MVISMQKSEILEDIRHFAVLQRKLCTALADEFDLTGDMEVVFKLPSKGCIDLGGTSWQFTRHGVGVRFIDSSSNTVIDAHKYPISCPNALDAWRLLQYFELRDHNKEISEARVSDLLIKLAEKGVIISSSDELYFLA